MSDRTLKLISVVVVIAVILSALNTYLILDALHVKEEVNELQNALDQLEEQEQQITDLQTTLNETKTSLEEATATLSELAGQINDLNQSTSDGLVEVNAQVEEMEDLVSELSRLEESIDQLLTPTPAEVYESTFRSVVVIRTPVGQGSGFMYNNQNTIVTNYHVVDDETDIEIEFFDRTRTHATVIGLDAYSDIAVLSVPDAPLQATPLPLGDPCSIGQHVVAIGNPLGLTESLSVGYISQVNRLLDIDPIIIPVLQLDLTVAPGSSGGPLLDFYGNVVGITNAGTEVGFNFAVPLTIMTRVIPALIADGEYKHPFVGVSILALTPEVVESMDIVNIDPYQTGLLITEVISGYPAEEAGLNPAVIGSQGYTAVDIVLALDGHPTFTIEDWTAYMEVNVSPGQSVVLSLWRSGETSSVTVTTTERPPY